MSIDLAAIQAKLAAPAGWGCDKECGRDEVKALLATTVALRDALRETLTMFPDKWVYWCSTSYVMGVTHGACGKCAGCLAYEAAVAALKAAEEVRNATE